MPLDPRQHSAEHILTAVFGNLFQGKIIDSRFKGNKVRCDYEIPSELALKLPLEEIIAAAEKRANDIIAENRAPTFEEISLEEAQKTYSLHRLPEDVATVRLVKFGADVITPCRYPHVENTSEIGTLKIRTFQYVGPGVIRLTFGVE